MAVDWDLLNELFDDLNDWADQDTDTGVSEISPAGQLRLDTNLGAAGNAKAARAQDIGSYPNEFTVEIKLYHDDIGAFANNDFLQLRFEQADEVLNMLFCSDGLFIRDTDAGWTEVGTDLVKEAGAAEWQTWRFLVTFGAVGDGVCDVYLKDSAHPNWTLVGENIPCSHETSGTDGRTLLMQYGNTTDNMISHVDHVKAAAGLHVPEEEVRKALFFGSNF